MRIRVVCKTPVSVLLHNVQHTGLERFGKEIVHDVFSRTERNLPSIDELYS